MLLIKDKLNDNSLKTSQKLQILTMAPDWPRAHVAKYFNVSEHMVCEARKLAREKGILALPEPKRGKCLSNEVENSAKLFYENDEYSRLMPGAKDYVSVARNVHQQKRLLLCNLKELYQSYKEKFSQHKIGLSKFCELRPKWCIPISSSGTHSVCVCTVHQNTKLIADAFCSAINKSIKKCERDFYKNKSKQMEADEEQEYEHKGETEQNFSLFNATYKNMLAMVVCNVQKMECMVHRCHKCPTYTALREYVELKFQEYDIEEDITYSQWDRTDRTILRTQTTPVDEFIELLVYHIDNLSKHSFIAKSQPRYLKAWKEEIDEETCIILLDFAKNYHFIVHDEVQGYHWNKDQCTLHPVVIYYKDQQNQLIHKSICFLSDNLE